MTETLIGKCTCGEISYRLNAPPLFVHCCHCSWCQRESGAAFALNALIESSLLEVSQGQPEAITLPTLSGNGQAVFRCPSCRVALWSHYVGAGEAVSFVRVGTLENPNLAPPDIHIFTESKQDWVILPEEVPAVEQYYRRSQHWPADSLQRFTALRNETSS